MASVDHGLRFLDDSQLHVIVTKCKGRNWQAAERELKSRKKRRAKERRDKNKRKAAQS